MQKQSRSHGYLWQNILEDVFLRGRQAGRELDIDTHDKIASLTGFLRDGHALTRESFLVTRLSGTGFGNANGFAVDGFDNAFPAGKGLFESQVDGRDKVVTLTLEGRMWFL